MSTKTKKYRKGEIPVSTMMETRILDFDLLNPRLVEGIEVTSQKDILRVLWQQMAVDEIAMSIAENGFFEHEPIFVTKEKSKRGRLIVIEGNRRLAAVKLLCDDKLRNELKATSLPKLSKPKKDELKKLPVIECNRNDIWHFIGFKHVNGAQPWSSYSKAVYVVRVHHEYGISLDQIANQIGDKNVTVKRFYHAMMVVKQAEAKGVYDRDDRTKKHFNFSHLTTALGYQGFRRFLGLSKESETKKSPVPSKKVKNLGEVCEWLFGSKSKEIDPVVKSQNPDLKILDEVLKSRDGIAALRRSLPLEISLKISRGDERLFREALIGAKQSLQEAKGIMPTGYNGEKDLLKSMENIYDISESLLDDMTRFKKRSR